MLKKHLRLLPLLVIELDGSPPLLVPRSLQAFIPASVQGELLQDLVVRSRISFQVEVQPSHLLYRHIKALGHICHPVLRDQHALRAPKTPEGCVGRQVGAAQEASATYVGHTV